MCLTLKALAVHLEAAGPLPQGVDYARTRGQRNDGSGLITALRGKDYEDLVPRKVSLGD